MRRVVTGGLALMASVGTLVVPSNGLVADLLADMQQHGGSAALRTLFRSAEADLRTWQLAYER